MTQSIGRAGAAKANGGAATIESVADILERELQSVIVDWLARVEQEPDLKSIPLSFEERAGHLLLAPLKKGAILAGAGRRQGSTRTRW